MSVLKRESLLASVFIFAVLVSYGGPDSGHAQDGASANSSDMLSLSKDEPGVLHTAMRYPKFYGDGNTVGGGLTERSYLLGELGGVRDALADYGVYANASVTQFLSGNLSGGVDTTDEPRVNGSADYWLWFDSGAAGLWPGGVVFLHGESSWKATESLNKDVGSLAAANTDATHPDPSQSNTTLSEVYLLQALPGGPLPGNFLTAVGKQNLAAFADTNTFANNERTQFQYAGLINNPIVGSFVPYTGYAAWLTWSLGQEHALTGIFSKATGTAADDDFDSLLDDENTYAAQYTYSSRFGGLPGKYTAIAAYSTKDIMNSDISDRQFLEESLGEVPVDTKDENYTFLLNVEQFFWTEAESRNAANQRLKDSDHPGVHQHHNGPQGVGVFARAGWAPDDRNVIDQFYSLGIGGRGILIPNRGNDTWGLGWSGIHISEDLRDLNPALRTFEHAGEVFYNLEVFPAAHLTINSQVIRPADKTVDTAYTLGARLQIDF